MTRPHFSFWIISGLGVVWNLMGCFNFAMQTSAEAVARLPETYQVIVESRPVWATLAFGVAVFGGALGCVLLLLRRAEARLLLLVSLVATALTIVQPVVQVGLTPSAFLALMVAGALFWYSSLTARAGWLRG